MKKLNNNDKLLAIVTINLGEEENNIIKVY